MRILAALVIAIVLSACSATPLAGDRIALAPLAPATAHCSARAAAPLVDWRVSDARDEFELVRWCRAVGSPVVVSVPGSSAPPRLDELTVISWNAHLAEGDLRRLVNELKSGALTGTPARHFVIAAQELYRRGDEVPAFEADNRTAHAIAPRHPGAPDIHDLAASLGLSIFYVPSMRNGATLHEDRGNAIISTEPLRDLMAAELPLARQRRVALAAAIDIQTGSGVRPLQIVDAHLEPLSAPESLWLLTDPRPAQVHALLRLLAEPRFTDADNAGVILGGDFNTVRGGDSEAAYRLARDWATSLDREDDRKTHMMGRLDYLFFRLPGGWTASTARLDDRFGSDHHPVMGTIRATR